MDLAFTPKNRLSRRDPQLGAGNLPEDIAHKVRNDLHLTRDDMQRWAKILGKKAGSATAGPRNSAAPAGAPCKSICSRKNAPAGTRRASCPSAP
jgi:hypothetical protein